MVETEEAKKLVAEAEAKKLEEAEAKEKEEAEAKEKEEAEAKETEAKETEEAEAKETEAKETEEAEAKEKEEAEAKEKEEAEKVENSKVDEIKTLSQAQVLLSKAAEEIQSLKSDMKKLKTEIEILKPKADRYAKLVGKQKMEAVDLLVKKKLSLGMIKKEDVKEQKEMLKSSKIKSIKLMASELGELKSVVRKESLKGSEGAIDESTATVKKLMAGAGFGKDFIKEYKKEGDE